MSNNSLYQSLFGSFCEVEQNLSFEVNRPKKKKGPDWQKIIRNNYFLGGIYLAANLILILFFILIIEKLSTLIVLGIALCKT